MSERVIFKNDVQDRLAAGDVILELGCGEHKRHREAIGVDVIDYESVDIVGDIGEVLAAMSDGAAVAVYSYHLFEHLEDIGKVMTALARVIKKGGLLVVVTPHFSSPYFYSDYTHRSSFGLYSFSYLARDLLFARKVPTYNRLPDFELRRVELIFKSPRPFYFRWGFKRILHLLVNLTRYTMEFYEENLCYLFPCYEIRYEMIKIG